jgi:hypothetical protein
MHWHWWKCLMWSKYVVRKLDTACLFNYLYILEQPTSSTHIFSLTLVLIGIYLKQSCSLWLSEQSFLNIFFILSVSADGIVRNKKMATLERHHFRFLSVSSAKSGDIFWNKFEETWFRQLSLTHFHIHTLDFEKMWRNDDVCSSLWLNSLCLVLVGVKLDNQGFVVSLYLYLISCIQYYCTTLSGLGWGLAFVT